MMIHRFVKRTPKPKATKKRSGLLAWLLLLVPPLALLELVGVAEPLNIVEATMTEVDIGEETAVAIYGVFNRDYGDVL